MTEYDAVVASTGPSLAIDRKRADDAIKAVVRAYGSVDNYKGIWVAAGTLGEQVYETSQRRKIVDRFTEAGVRMGRIRQIGGEDTMDKVRHIIALSEEEGLRNIGVSTYLLHYLRFAEGLKFAKSEGLAPKNLEFKLIWSSTTPLTRWPKDIMAGIAGLGVETLRLGRSGFSGAAPSNKPLERIYRPLKEWASDGEVVPMEEKER